jgi:hypothetical protein
MRTQRGEWHVTCGSCGIDSLRRLQRVRGDYGPDLYEAAYPTAVPVSVTPALTIDRLLELHQEERQEIAKTYDKRRAALAHLKRIAGHDDAVRVSARST